MPRQKTHKKLTSLIEAGLTNMQVLKAGTSLSAKLHNLNDRGVIAPGKRAGLVLLNSVPLVVNMSSTPDIVRVWIEGIKHEDVATPEWATH